MSLVQQLFFCFFQKFPVRNILLAVSLIRISKPYQKFPHLPQTNNHICTQTGNAMVAETKAFSPESGFCFPRNYGKGEICYEEQ